MQYEAASRIPWFGVFAVGDKFSKLDAIGRLTGQGVGHQYPALFYVTKEEDDRLRAQMRHGHLCKNEDVKTRNQLLGDFAPALYNP